MQFSRASSASKFLSFLAAAAALALLAGCTTVKLTNLTPASLPENASNIYTFTLRVDPRSSVVDVATLSPHIVVDGQNFAMTKSPLGNGIWEFEYQLPPGRDQIAYYFLVDYTAAGNGTSQPGQAYTGVQHATVLHRYILSLEGNRGPVGARISVLGRGFTPQDVINLDGTPARTVYESPTSLSFFVPAVATGKNYHVTLENPGGSSPVGTFRVDPTEVSVAPSSLTLTSGQTQNVTFTVPTPAPPGGLLIDVATDVPESVIMPEVVVPEGQTSVSVAVQGGKPGSGNLVLRGYGAGGQVTVPVTVSAK
ncbi:MAG TPA: cell surface protein [Opitutaceae bacterium]|nr:cell surface protein [Opitutaceae bacterium]